jgi:hypothetical protein
VLHIAHDEGLHHFTICLAMLVCGVYFFAWSCNCEQSL